ncbi:MAG: hypothetical protein ACC654_03210 [Acidimicrobiia bacterium]
MEPSFEDQPARAGRSTLVWILLISGIVLVSGFIPVVLAARAQPLENMYHNCVEGESGVHLDDKVQIETADGIPIAVRYGDPGSIPSEVEQLCFDLIVRVATYG